jgi:hypothetical protein
MAEIIVLDFLSKSFRVKNTGEKIITENGVQTATIK